MDPSKKLTGYWEDPTGFLERSSMAMVEASASAYQLRILIQVQKKLIPGAGVYACRVDIRNQFWASAVNVGTRPTF